MTLDRPVLYDQDGQRRWEELVQEMTASGEVSHDQLDLSASSLRAVWQWLLPRLRRRPTGESVDEAVQPPWWSGPSWRRCAGWDDATHHRISGVAHHLRQVLLAQPGAAAGLGEVGTVDAGEPVVRIGDQLDVDPLREVMMALADVWNGRPDPEALVAVVERPALVLPPELLWPTRLVLRLRGPASGVLRRRRELDTSTVADGLADLLQQPVARPADGRTETEHLGGQDWRALLSLTGDRQRLREVELVLGAPWESGSDDRGPAVHQLVHGVVELAEHAGAEVDVVKAVPDDQHAPRPTGRLLPADIGSVLRAVGL